MRNMARWLASRVRLYRPDRNPLRRGSDRIEALFVVLFLLMFTAGLVLAPIFGRQVYENGLRAERAGRWVTARLLEDAPRPALAPYSGQTAPRAEVTWTGPGGRPEIATVPVSPGAKAGSTTRLWVDGSGRVTPAPPRREERVAQAIAVGLTTVLLSSGLALAGYALVRVVLDRRRLAAWGAEWLVAEREWRRRRRP